MREAVADGQRTAGGGWPQVGRGRLGDAALPVSTVFVTTADPRGGWPAPEPISSRCSSECRALVLLSSACSRLIYVLCAWLGRGRALRPPSQARSLYYVLCIVS